MAHWLKVLAALPKDSGLISNTHMVTYYNSRSKGYDSLFWPPQEPGMHVVHQTINHIYT